MTGRGASAVQSGDVLAGRYLVDRVLHEGEHSRLVAASDRDANGKRVTIKLFRSEREPAALCELADREIGLLLRAQTQRGGAHVARPVEATVRERDGLTFIVLTLPEGPSLAEVIAHAAPFQEAKARRIGAGIAAGLAAIHAAGGMHGALEPAGVVLRGPLDPVLRDVGVDSALQDLRATGDDGRATSAGASDLTWCHAAPEQLAGEQVLPASDVYRLGLILVEMLTGHVPLTGRTRAETLEIRATFAALALRLAGQPIPGPVADLAVRCLEPDPERRPSAAEVARRLGDTRRWRPGVLAGGGATVVAAVVVGGMAAWDEPVVTATPPAPANWQMGFHRVEKSAAPPGPAAAAPPRRPVHSGTTITFPHPPVKLADLGSVKQIANGRVAAILGLNGVVWSWEPDAGYRMRTGRAPYPLNAPSATVELVGGGSFPLLIGADGKVTTWSQPRQSFMTVPGLSDVVDAALGGYHLVALHRDGTVSLMDRYTALSPTPLPVRIPDLSHVVAVAAGSSGDSAALTEGFEIRRWSHLTGQLTYGPFEVKQPKTEITAVERLLPLPNVVAIALLGSELLALDRNGALHRANASNAWSQVRGLPPIKAISAASSVAAALDVDGGVWQWGTMGFGDQYEIRIPEPARVEGLPAVVAVGADIGQSMALDEHGGVWVWGPVTDCDLPGSGEHPPCN